MKKAYITVYALILSLLLFTTIAFLLNGAELMIHSTHYKQQNLQLRLDAESDAVEIISQIDNINDAIVNRKFGTHTIPSVRDKNISYYLYRVQTDRTKLTYDTYIKFTTRNGPTKLNGIISFQPKYDLNQPSWSEEDMRSFLDRGVKEFNRTELVSIDYPAVVYTKNRTMYVAEKEKFYALREKLIREHENKYRKTPDPDNVPPMTQNNGIFTQQTSLLDTLPSPSEEFPEMPDITEIETPETPSPTIPLPEYTDETIEEDPIPPYEDDYDRMITESLDGEPVFSGFSSLILTEPVEFVGENILFRGILLDTGEVSCEQSVTIDGILFATIPSVSYQLQRGKCISTDALDLTTDNDFSPVMAMMKAYDEVKYRTLSIR